MTFRDKQREAGRSMLAGSIKGLGNLAAAAATFLLTPLAYGATIDWVEDFTSEHYGRDWTDISGIVWFVIVAGVVFFTARASITTLITMGGFALASRLF